MVSAMRTRVLAFVVINFGLPMAIFALCSGRMSDVVALTLSGIPPAAQALHGVVKHKIFDVIALTVLFSIVASVLLAVLTSDARLLLVKDSFVTFVTGTAFLGSLCCATENLIWRYNRQFAGPDAQADLDAKWAYPEVQRTTRLICVVWGVGLIFEALLRVVLVYVLPVHTMGYLSTIIMLTFVGMLVAWTLLYTRSRANAQAALEVDTPFTEA
ncbi:hypothetical protein ACHHYP_15202 [Achlya hypogyna]|uniref:Transmembrane protein n=1 Tax=Achlya hypogyna TaxID=1202772 RepID=A0A1V9YBE1_ACHHY|nr:hypothetical protein ACHHYP_15202 [Achlya hypogyna]